jgi:hypothetical protein
MLGLAVIELLPKRTKPSFTMMDKRDLNAEVFYSHVFCFVLNAGFQVDPVALGQSQVKIVSD